MSEAHEIDADFSPLHGVVKFRNGDQKYLVISASKANSNAKNLREAASLISSSEDRPKAVVQWLLNQAEAFERCKKTTLTVNKAEKANKPVEQP